MLLRIGSSGLSVKNLQESLNTAIPLEPLLDLDGIFGPKTNARVIAFQQQAGLGADGIVGPLTSKALIAAVLNIIARRG